MLVPYKDMLAGHLLPDLAQPQDHQGKIPECPNHLLSRVGVTWYTFKQKGPKFRHGWYKGAYFCKIVKFFGHYNRLKCQTLNGRLPTKDSSVSDDSVCVLIVMT